ncbi:Subtilisin-like serine germination related protease [Romboutsia lituseburensis]|nr:S8 family peptidase [Romboutsia lituseburensis]CEH33565.1 Subtilisin-like serine germination related protease [Romboutsia lituseburensis]
MSEVSQGTSGGTVALEDIGANYFKNNPNVSITGKGVFIAIIDSGIDYLHEDFIYPDRTSKVAFLWDQTKDGNPPKGFAIGTEYTKEDINKAIQNNDATLSVDEEGSGTMLSGICAGLGNLNKEYAGVAEDAELIVIKMRKIGGYYNNAMLYAAIEYITQKSLELKTPVVINISLGTNNMVQLNSRVIEERTFFTRGICIVAATGNEGNAQTHTSGQMKFKEDINEIEIEVAEDEPLLEIQVIVNRPDKIKVGIVSPSNEESRLLEVSNYNEITGLFDLEGTEYLITYIYPTLYSGQQQATITLINVTKGIWKLRLVGQYITNGRYEVYLQNRVFLKPGTKFRDPDPGNTINYPAVYEDIISIGAYDTKNDNLWPQSSKGPTVEGSLKPAIVAPGVDIIAPYPGNKYATITGTAVAAAYTSGAVALYLQYTLVDRRYMNRGFVQQIRTYLRAGAKRSANISYPNYGYGYGLLNIKGVFDQLR